MSQTLSLQKNVIEKYPEIIQGIQNGEISWESIGLEFQRTRV